MEYKTPKSVRSAVKKATMKKKIKASAAKDKKKKEPSIAEGKGLKPAETGKMTSEEAKAGYGYAKARSDLEYNLNKFKTATAKGLKPKKSAYEKLRKKVERYKNTMNTPEAKAYRKKEKLQKLDYSLME